MTLEERWAWQVRLANDETMVVGGREMRAREVALALCADKVEGPAFFINVFGWSLDPRPNPQTGRPIGEIPMLLWPRQKEMLAAFTSAIDDRVDLLISKDRDTGATVGVSLEVLRQWLFVPGFNALLSSRIEDLVDSSVDPRSMFYKIMTTLRMLPDWMLPKGYSEKQHRTFKRLYNPENGNTIAGAAPGPNFANGPRASVVVLDEWSLWENSSGYDNAAATTDTRVAIFTPGDSPENHAYQCREGIGHYAGAKPRVFRITWHDDPRKQEFAWCPVLKEKYNTWERRTRGEPRLNIQGRMAGGAFRRDYGDEWAPLEGGKIYADAFTATRLVRALSAPKTGGVWLTTIDPGLDTTYMAFALFRPKECRLEIHREFSIEGQDAMYFLPFYQGREYRGIDKSYFYDQGAVALMDWMDENLSVYDRMEGRRRPQFYAHFGDRFGDSGSWGARGGTSGYGVLIDHGIQVEFSHDKEDVHHTYRIDRLRRWLPYTTMSEEGAPLMVSAMRNYAYRAGVPVHSRHSHPATAMEYLVAGIERHWGVPRAIVNPPHLEGVGATEEVNPLDAILDSLGALAGERVSTYG